MDWCEWENSCLGLKKLGVNKCWIHGGGGGKVVQTGFTRLWGKLRWGNRIALLKAERDGRWQAFDRNVVVISCHVIPAGLENELFSQKAIFTYCSGISVALKLLRASWANTGFVPGTSDLPGSPAAGNPLLLSIICSVLQQCSGVSSEEKTQF